MPAAEVPFGMASPDLLPLDDEGLLERAQECMVCGHGL